MSFEDLEDRLTPSSNIIVNSIAVTDNSGNLLGSVSTGSFVSLQVKFSTVNLPAGNYAINYDINGLIQSDTLSLSGTNNYTDYLKPVYSGYGPFVASEGTNVDNVTVDPTGPYTQNSLNGTFTATGNTGMSYNVAQIRNAYGLNSIPDFGTSTPDGTGQTIAIVDAFNDPTVFTDLDSFDQGMTLSTSSTETLYQAYGAASSFLNVYNQAGVNITGSIANSGVGAVPKQDIGWNGEETLDVQWAHAIAPGAKIDLIEADNPGTLFTGETAAANLPGVSVVSNSWGGPESSSELSQDSDFVTPSGHTGITFLVSSGDVAAVSVGSTPGSSGTSFSSPATSPNVIAVGGTNLVLDNNNYVSESGWSLPKPAADGTVTFGGTGYSQTGSWSTQTGGFSGNYGTAAGGSSSQAVWSITVPGDASGSFGGTAVSVTWTAGAGNATNAQYQIYDGTQSGTLLATIPVNQTIAPVGITDGNSQFQSLGVYFPSSGKITVVLSAKNANGNVVADALGLAVDEGSTGGISQYEAEPSYQEGVQSTGQRTFPDVSFIGDPQNGVTVFGEGQTGSYPAPGFSYGIGGTSLSCPCWAGMMAIVNQGRMTFGGETFDSPSNPQQALNAIYNLYSVSPTDFNQVLTGYNGFSDGSGYNEVTGLGTPIANEVIPALVAYDLTPLVTSVTPDAGPLSGGTTVTITGDGLLNATAVEFGGISGTIVSDTANQIVVTSPQGGSAGIVDITVTTSLGTSPTESSDKFTYEAPPSISTISPSQGPASGGTTVTINGSNLSFVSQVLFGGQAATIVSDPSSGNQIVVIDPSGSVGSATVSVTTVGGSTTGSFTYLPSPVITSTSPSVGPLTGNTTITLTGNDLANVTSVDFGTVAGTILSDNGSQIIVTDPAESAGTVTVTVTTLGGVATSQFTYVAVPAITAISPSSGPTSGGTSVTLTGTALANAIEVEFGGVLGTITSDTANHIVVTSPAGTAGTVDITVITAGGVSSTSPADQFSYVPAPVLTGIAPPEGPLTGGTTVVITGTDLSNAISVNFGGVAGTILSNSPTQIVVTTPAGSAGTATVTVTTIGGTDSGSFTYVPPPVMSSLNPADGPLAGDTTITITGTNLAGATSVNFGSLAATIVSDTATQIIVTNPAEPVGTVAVVVATAGGTSSLSYTYVAQPTVTSISPTIGPASGGTTVTITGTALANASAVDFGSVPATIVSDTATQIVVKSPVEVGGVVDVTVTTVGGTSATSSADQFTSVPAPAITGFSQPAGPLSGGEAITISGTNMGSVSSVDFGLNAANIVSVSANQVVVLDPSSGTSGPVTVTVTSPFGSGTGTFDYVAAPVITSINPPYGSVDGGTSVDISGTNLNFITSVDFGSKAGTIVSDSPNLIVVTSPAGSLGIVSITVTTLGGTAGGTSNQDFQYYNPPSVTGISPTYGSPTGGTVVTITGTNLTNGQVDFGGVEGTIDNLSPTQIVVTSPANSAGLVDVIVTTPGGPSSATPADQFYYEPPVSPSNSTISLTSSTVQSGSAITVTLQTKDSSGNNIIRGGATVVFGLGSTAGATGTFSAVTDNGNGTYTATFTGTIAGLNSITAFANNQAISSSPSITVTPGPVSLATSVVTSPSSVQSGKGVTVELQTEDADGNDNPSGIQSVAFALGSTSGGQGAFSSVTNLGNGLYSATFIGSTAGSNTITATINGQSITTTPASITVTPGVLSLANSILLLPPPGSVQAGNSVTVTLQTEDADGNDLTTGGQTVVFGLVGNTGAQGTFGPVIDHNNGTYTATFTGTTEGTNTIAATIGNQAITSQLPTITVTAGLVSLSESTVTIPSNTTLQSGSSITVDLQVEDSEGNDNPTGIQSVAFTLGSASGGLGTFSSITNLGKGLYSATFTATIAGVNTVTAEINGNPITSSAPSITVTPGPLSLANSLVLLPSPAIVQEDGTITVALQTEDAVGNNIPTGGQTVVFALGSSTGGQGTFGPVLDHGNGIYTATFTGTVLGINTITATINGEAVTSTAPTITIAAGPVSLSDSVVEVASNSISGGSSTTVTLKAVDAEGDPEGGNLDVAFSLGSAHGGQGTFSSVSYIGNGTYSATFTGTSLGSNTIVATINNQALTSSPQTITVTLGQVSPTESDVVLGSSSIQLGGTTTVTLYAKDAGGNLETSSNYSVSFELSGSGGKGTFSAVTNKHDGTYTATFKGTLDGTNTIDAVINNNGQLVTAQGAPITVTGAAYSLSASTITVATSTVPSGQTTTITLQAESAGGVKETSGGLTVAFALGSTSGGKGTIGPVTDLGNGTYQATFTAVKAGVNTIVATIDGVKVTSTAPKITVTAGAISLAKSTVTVSATSVKAGSMLTVTLHARDANGNVITTGGLTDITFNLGNGTAQGTFSSTTDQNNGTYTATFTGEIVGTNTISASVGGSPVTTAPPTITVTHGAFSLAKSSVMISQASLASGSKETVTLQARDAYGNKIPTGGLVVGFVLGNGANSPGKGTFSAVTDHHNGTYTATFTGTIAGSNTIVATINGSKVTSTPPTITVTPGPFSLAKSIVTDSPGTVQSGSTITITLLVEDASGNPETSGGLSVVFALGSAQGGQAVISTASYAGNGMYTATLAGVAAGSNTITATINGQKVTSVAPAITVTP